MLSKRYKSTEVDCRTWLHVPSGTPWSTSSDTHQVVTIQYKKRLLRRCIHHFNQVEMWGTQRKLKKKMPLPPAYPLHFFLYFAKIHYPWFCIPSLITSALPYTGRFFVFVLVDIYLLFITRLLTGLQSKSGLWIGENRLSVGQSVRPSVCLSVVNNLC